ncbi:MAG: hypothetical protein QXD98_00380 [Candidatus Diapherotrites archaeon]
MNKIEIIVDLDDAGNAKVVENYHLYFVSDFEFEDFKNEVLVNSSSILTWQAKFDFFYPRFGSRAGKEIFSNQIVFDEQKRVLSLSYDVKNFANVLSSGQRVWLFNIDSKVFNAFIDTGTISIPDNVIIIISFPSNAQVETSSLAPGLKFSDNKLTLSALKINSISVNYFIVKSILPNDNNSILSFSDNYIILLISILLFAIVQTQKETIEKRLEQFIVKHSEIKKKIDDEIEV